MTLGYASREPSWQDITFMHDVNVLKHAHFAQCGGIVRTLIGRFAAISRSAALPCLAERIDRFEPAHGMG